MKKGRTFGLILLLGTLILYSFGLPGNIRKKMEKEVQKTFDVEEFGLSEVAVSESVNSGLPTGVNGEKLFRVEQEGHLLGYVFVDEAPSKTAMFDFLVIFNSELEIVNSKVLVYREEYGGEIGSNRWLRQFEGKTGNDRVSPETNIDAISGATISVRSMTRSIDNLLQTIGILQQKQLL